MNLRVEESEFLADLKQEFILEELSEVRACAEKVMNNLQRYIRHNRDHNDIYSLTNKHALVQRFVAECNI